MQNERDYLSDDFASEVFALGYGQEPFSRILYYDPDGDCIEFVAEPHSYNAERVDAILTVYYSTETNELVGAKIKSVRNLLRRHNSLSIAVKDCGVRLSLLVVGALNAERPEQGLDLAYVKKYQSLIDLIDKAGGNDFVEAPDLCGVCA